MVKITPFYTVIQVPSGRFTIRFVEPPDWTIREQGCNYDDPGEAIQEFKKYERHQNSGRLTKVAFDYRIKHHRQDMEKLRSWTCDTQR